MLFRVFEREDGRLALWRPLVPKHDSEDDAAYFAREGWRASFDTSLDGLPYVDVEQADLPADRATRDRWRLRDGKVVVGPQPKTRKPE